MTKTDAAAQTLGGINPDVQLESYTMNITTVAGFEAFKATLVDPATGEAPGETPAYLPAYCLVKSHKRLNEGVISTSASSCLMSWVELSRR